MQPVSAHVMLPVPRMKAGHLMVLRSDDAIAV
jgi:hypothetical protein